MAALHEACAAATTSPLRLGRFPPFSLSPLLLHEISSIVFPTTASPSAHTFFAVDGLRHPLVSLFFSYETCNVAISESSSPAIHTFAGDLHQQFLHGALANAYPRLLALRIDDCLSLNLFDTTQISSALSAIVGSFEASPPSTRVSASGDSLSRSFIFFQTFLFFSMFLLELGSTVTTSTTFSSFANLISSFLSTVIFLLSLRNSLISSSAAFLPGSRLLH